MLPLPSLTYLDVKRMIQKNVGYTLNCLRSKNYIINQAITLCQWPKMLSSKPCDRSDVFMLWNSMGLPIRRKCIKTSLSILLLLAVSPMETLQPLPAKVSLKNLHHWFPLATLCLLQKSLSQQPRPITLSTFYVSHHNLTKQINLLSPLYSYFTENWGWERLSDLSQGK